MTSLLVHWAARDAVREAAMSAPAARDLVNRYVAGQTLDDLVPVLRLLASRGLRFSVEYLGVPVEVPADAARNLQGYLDLVQRLRDEGIAPGAELSVRLGWLGQELRDEVLDGGRTGGELALAYARLVCRASSNAGAFVTIDMSHHELVDGTLAIWRELHQDLPGTGITLQAALRRTEDDAREIAMPGVRVRLCKGSFRAPRSVAHRGKHDVDLAFVRTLRMLMSSQAVPLVATHDPRLVAISEELIRRTGRAADSYEFQMLYGIRPLEQRRLVDIGHTARVYVPFGPGWYDYYVRNLAERPANTALFIRSMLGKR
ncbi:proline dehydrogenase family protein [Brooklawnia cerclae]|uniref:Proline dehydrogenase n=1 Tax=Brooklawnia cerclae TaxID=349934 RepID=A0ABX0SB18_9ACTN|nr:proline dehydrogenase family protein [Brooklawnia cerclae]NIH55594.1 proline dehydrogenase [Brooklawnia cerclae]